MDKIIGIGNALVDVLVHVSDERLAAMNLPKGSTQFIGRKQFIESRSTIAAMNPARARGGSAANTISALANLGNSSGLIAKTGRDEDGDFYEAECRKAGTDTLLKRSGTPTGVATTFITPDGQRTFLDYLGAAVELTADDITDNMLAGYKYLYLEGYLVQNHALVDSVVSTAKRMGMKICLDMASYNIVESDLEYFTTLVRNYVDIVFANEEESLAFTGLEPAKALETIAGMCDIAIVKLGAKGSTAARRDASSGTLEKAAVAAGKVEHVTDTTAAGDFFAAGFLHALVHGRTLEECLEAGTVLSSEIIQVVGATLPEERWNEVRRRINEICK